MRLSSEQIGEPLAKTGQGRYDEMRDVNVKGVFFSMQAVSPILRDGGSVILNTCFLNTVGFPGLSVLPASKAAVRSLARSWRREFLDRVIRVDAVSPGAIKTPIQEMFGGTPDEVREKRRQLAALAPAGGIGEVDETADAALFLASDESRYAEGRRFRHRDSRRAERPAAPGSWCFAGRQDRGCRSIGLRDHPVGHIVHLAGRRDPTLLLVGANAGHVDSFVKDAAEELGWADAPDSGSQLRSRDNFPRAVVELLSGRGESKKRKPAEIPDVPVGKLAYTDGYDNLLAPGGSGPPVRGGKVQWLELYLRGGNASEAFGRPESGGRRQVGTEGRAGRNRWRWHETREACSSFDGLPHIRPGNPGILGDWRRFCIRCLLCMPQGTASSQAALNKLVRMRRGPLRAARPDGIPTMRTRPTNPSPPEMFRQIPAVARRLSFMPSLAKFIGLYCTYLSLVAGAVVLPGWPVKAFCAAAASLAVGGLYVLGHDAGHGILVPGYRLNRWLARLAFLPAYAPLASWHRAHVLLHHNSLRVRGKDMVWMPWSLDDYRSASAWGRGWYRFLRTVPGLSFYWTVGNWFPYLLFPPGTALGPRTKQFRVDRVLVLAFAAGLFASLCVLAHAAAAWRWAEPVGPAGVAMLGLVAPYLCWTWFVGLIDLVHHTHPRSICFADASEWDYYDATVRSTVHVILPFGLHWLANNILEHNAHHVDPRVPLHNLPEAQERLAAAYPEDVHTEHLSLSYVLWLFRTCRLYDYERRRWLDYDGTPTSEAMRHTALEPA